MEDRASVDAGAIFFIPPKKKFMGTNLINVKTGFFVSLFIGPNLTNPKLFRIVNEPLCPFKSKT